MAPAKLHGRAFYESIGSPKYIIAPMVDQSEFAWRMLTRSFLPPDLRSSILAYSPMLHAKLFADTPKYRAQHFEPLKPPLTMADPPDPEHFNVMAEGDMYLDGNPEFDRPLFVQFCANDPDVFFNAAKIVQPYCDAVDLNLGCPQGIAKRGNYGAFLQEDWDIIHKLINRLHTELDIPVTAKFRIQETREKTLEYAKMILNAGASIIAVHGRQRHQKGHETGLADWSIIRWLREQLPKETVIFANGNILQREDIQKCLDETGADGVMSAEGNLYDPSIFATPPPVGEEGTLYWRGRDGKGGYRADAVLRRYLDIIHKFVLHQEPPPREPLYLPSDEHPPSNTPPTQPAPAPEPQPGDKRRADDNNTSAVCSTPPATKKQRRSEAKQTQKTTGAKPEKCTNPNLTAMQPHCFHILRSLVSTHHDVRDALARSRAGDMDAYEDVLRRTQRVVRDGLVAYAKDPTPFEGEEDDAGGEDAGDPTLSSSAAVRRCRRPFWVCQPYVRPLPREALEKGSLMLSKRDKKRLEKERLEKEMLEKERAGVKAEGRVDVVESAGPGPGAGEGGKLADGLVMRNDTDGANDTTTTTTEVPKEGMVCG
jgi:tRNA-dihydrouridine synthase 1